MLRRKIGGEWSRWEFLSGMRTEFGISLEAFPISHPTAWSRDLPWEWRCSNSASEFQPLWMTFPRTKLGFYPWTEVNLRSPLPPALFQLHSQPHCSSQLTFPLWKGHHWCGKCEILLTAPDGCGIYPLEMAVWSIPTFSPFSPGIPEAPSLPEAPGSPWKEPR